MLRAVGGGGGGVVRKVVLGQMELVSVAAGGGGGGGTREAVGGRMELVAVVVGALNVVTLVGGISEYGFTWGIGS